MSGSIVTALTSFITGEDEQRRRQPTCRQTTVSSHLHQRCRLAEAHVLAIEVDNSLSASHPLFSCGIEEICRLCFQSSYTHCPHRSIVARGLLAEQISIFPVTKNKMVITFFHKLYTC